MKLRVQSSNFDASAQLEAYVEKKVGKLERFYPEILNADVVLTLEKPETNLNKVAKITLSIKGSDPFAEKTADTFEEAVTLACEALEKQLGKIKEKMRAK